MQDPIIPQLGTPISQDNTPDVSENAHIGGPPDRHEGWRGALSTLAILVAAPVIALLLINFVFQSYQVDGPSMEATLQNQDRLIVDKIPKTMARVTGRQYVPKRGDVIIFIKHGLIEFGGGGDKQLIKRVIGLPGEKVVVKDGKYTVYNKQHPDGFNPDVNVPWSSTAFTDTSGAVDITVGQTEVFVSGDNRPNSLDSRAFGPISTTDIVGKLSYRIFPVNKAQHF